MSIPYPEPTQNRRRSSKMYRKLSNASPKCVDAIASLKHAPSIHQQRYSSVQSAQKRHHSPAHVAPAEYTKSQIRSQSGGPVSVFSRLPMKVLLRSLLVTTVSSHRALLTPALSILSFLTQSRGFLFNPERNPLIRGGLRRTLYDHFCAGETESQTRGVIRQIKDVGYRGVILTYSRETVTDHRKEQHSDQSVTASSGSDSVKQHCEVIEAWKDGTLKTVDMLSEGDFLALK